jgi:hypothetical protein
MWKIKAVITFIFLIAVGYGLYWANINPEHEQRHVAVLLTKLANMGFIFSVFLTYFSYKRKPKNNVDKKDK